MFLVDIQCRIDGFLIEYKISIVYIVGKIIMKKNYISPREHATNVINFEKKKMLLLTKKS